MAVLLENSRFVSTWVVFVSDLISGPTNWPDINLHRYTCLLYQASRCSSLPWQHWFSSIRQHAIVCHCNRISNCVRNLTIIKMFMSRKGFLIPQPDVQKSVFCIVVYISYAVVSSAEFWWKEEPIFAKRGTLVVRLTSTKWMVRCEYVNSCIQLPIEQKMYD